MCISLSLSQQDDSALNCKVVSKLIENEKEGVFAGATLLTADDGATAVEQLRMERAAGRPVHFILMDYVMVRAVAYLKSLNVCTWICVIVPVCVCMYV